MQSKRNKNYEDLYYTKFLTTLLNDETFKMGRKFQKYAPKTLSCKKCGNTEFKIGEGDYYLAISCPLCKWQACLYEE